MIDALAAVSDKDIAAACLVGLFLWLLFGLWIPTARINKRHRQREAARLAAARQRRAGHYNGRRI